MTKEDGPEQIKAKATTILHQEGMKFVDAPSYLKNQGNVGVQNFIPKKWVYTFKGHSTGVTKVKFFPKYGHLMLSASHDGSCKIWDVMTTRKCLRTYMGH